MKLFFIALSLFALTNCKVIQNGFGTKSDSNDQAATEEVPETLANLIRTESELREAEYRGVVDGLPTDTCKNEILRGKTTADEASKSCIEQVMTRASALLKVKDFFNDAMVNALESLERSSAEFEKTNPLVLNSALGVVSDQNLDPAKTAAATSLAKLMGESLNRKQKFRANLVPTVHFDDAGSMRCINFSWMFSENKIEPKIELRLVDWENHGSGGGAYQSLVTKDWIVLLAEESNPYFNVSYVAAEFTVSSRATSDLVFIPINRSYFDAYNLKQGDPSILKCNNVSGQPNACGIRVVQNNTGKCPLLSVYTDSN